MFLVRNLHLQTVWVFLLVGFGALQASVTPTKTPVFQCSRLIFTFKYENASTAGFNMNDLKQKDVLDAIEVYLKDIIRTTVTCAMFGFEYPLMALTTFTFKPVYRVYYPLTIKLEASGQRRNNGPRVFELCLHKIRKNFNRTTGPDITDGKEVLRPFMKSVNQKPCCPFGLKYIKNACACPKGFYIKHVPRTIPQIRCQRCEQDSYQDQAGQFNCKLCPQKRNTTCGVLGAESINCCKKGCDISCPTTKTYTNNQLIHWNATAARTLVKVLCPGGRKNQFTRWCYRNGTWGKIKQFSCGEKANLLTCQINTITTVVGAIHWPTTTAGKTIAVKCPNGPKNAKALRSCLASGDWGETNISMCYNETLQTKELNELHEKKVTKDNAKKVTTELKNFTSKHNPKNLNLKDVELITNMLESILNFTDSLEETSKDVVLIFDKVLQVNESAMDSSITNRLAVGIETLAQNLPIPANKSSSTIHTEKFVITTNYINIQSNDPLVVDLSGATKAQTRNANEITEEDIKETFTIPLELIQNLNTREEKQRKLGTVLYLTSKLFSTGVGLHNNSSTSSVLNSRVISAGIKGVKVQNLSEPVVIVFKSLKEIPGSVPQCVFWDYEALGGYGAWSGKGCSQSKTSTLVSKRRVTCQCNHMTNFAVLFSPRNVGRDDTHEKHNIALSMISYIGCGISIFGLLLTFLTYTLFRNLRKTNAQPILMNLCVALMLLMIVFLVGAAAKLGRSACRVIAVLIHYSMLAVVMWMAVEGYQMYLAFIKVMATYQRSFMVKSLVVGWCFPALFVVPTVAGATDYYGNGNLCILTGVPFYATMFAPTILIITINFVIFCFVMWSLARSGSMYTEAKRTSSYQRCCTGIAITILLGLSWIFGALAFGLGFTDLESSRKAHLVFEYLFCIFNSLQGLFIFLFHCARHEEVRSHWKSFFTGHGLNNYSSQYYQRSHGIGENFEGKVPRKISQAQNPENSSDHRSPKCVKNNRYCSPDINKKSSVHRNTAFEANEESNTSNV